MAIRSAFNMNPTYTPLVQPGQSAFGSLPPVGTASKPFTPMPAAPQPVAPSPAAAPQQTNPDAFKALIVAKYPDGVASDGTKYADMSAQDLTQKIVSKFPDGVTNDGRKYSDFMPPQPTTGSAGQPLLPNSTLGSNLARIPSDVSGVATAITNGLGFGKSADTIGQIIANKTASPETKPLLPLPSAKDTLGAALNVGSMLIPTGAVERGGASVLGRVVAPKLAAMGGKVAAGVAVGGALDAGQNLEQGRNPLTPGIGTALGVAGPLAAEGVKTVGGALSNVAENSAPRLINSLIKPLAKDFAYGKNPGRTISELGITANSLDELGQKVTQARQEVGQAIGKVGDSLEGKVELKLGSSLGPIDDAIQTAVAQRNQAAVSRLQNIKEALTHVSGLNPKTGQIESQGSVLLDNASFKTAREMLGKIGDMTQFTGNPSDDKLVNSALKQVYGSIKGATLDAAKSVNPTIAKQFTKLTEQYSDLTSAKVATEYRDKVGQRLNMVGLSPTIAGIGTALLTAIATGGAAIPAILAGGAGAGIDKALSSVAVKTRVASLLAKRSPQEVEALTKAIPQLKQFTSPGDMLLNAAKSHLKENPLSAGMAIKSTLPEPASLVKNMDAEDIKTVRQYTDLLDGKVASGGTADVEATMKMDSLLDNMGIKPSKFATQRAKDQFITALRDAAQN